MRRQRSGAVGVLARQQRGDVTRDKGAAKGVTRFVYPSTSCLGRSIRGDDGPVLVLARGRVHLGDVTGLATEGAHVSLAVGQPIVALFHAVAGFTASLCVVKLRSDQALSALTFGELVQWAIEIIAQIDATRIECEVVRPALGRLLEIDRVVKRIVTIGAFDDPFGMNVPRAPRASFEEMFMPESEIRCGETIWPVVIVLHCSGEQLSRAKGVCESTWTNP